MVAEWACPMAPSIHACYTTDVTTVMRVRPIPTIRRSVLCSGELERGVSSSAILTNLTNLTKLTSIDQ